MHSRRRMTLTLTKENEQALEQLKQTKFRDTTYTEMCRELIRMGLEAVGNGAALVGAEGCGYENK